MAMEQKYGDGGEYLEIGAVYSYCRVVDFHSKLRRRVKELDLNKAKASRDAHLPDSTIGSYLSKPKSLPRIDIAVKIATALKVPVQWLIDNREDWPPPDASSAAQPLRDATDAQLIHEVARRFRQAMVDFHSEFNNALSMDWPRLAAEASLVGPTDPWPDHWRLADSQL